MNRLSFAILTNKLFNEWIKNNKFIYFLDAEKNIDDAVDMVIKHAGESYSNIMTRDGFAELKKLIKQELC